MQNHPPASWAILGLGGLGATLAYTWTTQGKTPNIVGLVRSQGVVRRRPFSVTLSRHGTTQPATITCYQTSYAPKTLEVVWVTCRTHDLSMALEKLAPRVSPNTIIVLSQCGLGFDEAILHAFPTHRIVFLVSRAQCRRRGQTILASSTPLNADLGMFSGVTLTRAERQPLIHALNAAGFNVRWHENIQPIRALKWAIDCTITPLSVLHHCNDAHLFSDPDYHQHAKLLSMESHRVLKHVAPGVSAHHLWQQTITVLQQSNVKQSIKSIEETHQHLQELPYLNGYLIEQASHQLEACPNHEAVVTELLAGHPPH